MDNGLMSSGLSSALLELKFLTHLDLSWNNFNGSQIPEFIGSMTKLRYRNLSAAGFSGRVPPQLGKLTNLIHLDLNAFGDCLPNLSKQGRVCLYVDRVEWVSGLSKLQSLDMGSIDMSRLNDTIQVLIKLPSLLALSLSDFALQNTHLFPLFIANASSSTLQNLDLSFNYLKGPFPSFIEHIGSLHSLSLRNNGFNGSVPFWLGNIRHVEYLDLGVNSFNKVEGGLWGIMGNPCNFKYVDLSRNLIVQGNFLVSSVNSLTCTSFDLEYLDLHSNQINDGLTTLLGQFADLKYLDLSSNRFQGQVPSSLGKLLSLEYLDFSYNNLSGLIPDVLGYLSKIDRAPRYFIKLTLRHRLWYR